MHIVHFWRFKPFIHSVIDVSFPIFANGFIFPPKSRALPGSSSLQRCPWFQPMNRYTVGSSSTMDRGSWSQRSIFSALRTGTRDDFSTMDRDSNAPFGPWTETHHYHCPAFQFHRQRHSLHAYSIRRNTGTSEFHWHRLQSWQQKHSRNLNLYSPRAHL